MAVFDSLRDKKKKILDLPGNFRKIGWQLEAVAVSIDKKKAGSKQITILKDNSKRFEDFAKLKALWIYRPIPFLRRVPKTFLKASKRLDEVALNIYNKDFLKKDAVDLHDTAADFERLASLIEGKMLGKYKI